MEVATEKQAIGLVCNCDRIFELIRDHRKMLVTPEVRYFRVSCCTVSGHCVNLEEGGYRKGMPEDLSRVKDAAEEVCREGGMWHFKVVSPVEMLEIRTMMDENDLIQILGENCRPHGPKGGIRC